MSHEHSPNTQYLDMAPTCHEIQQTPHNITASVPLGPQISCRRWVHECVNAGHTGVTERLCSLGAALNLDSNPWAKAQR